VVEEAASDHDDPASRSVTDTAAGGPAEQPDDASETDGSAFHTPLDEVERQLRQADPPPTLAVPLNPREAAAVARTHSDTKLSRIVAGIALGIMALQIVAADGAFYMYGNGNNWHIPVAAIQAWLAATVIQVVSIVLVIARSLFPGKGSQ
jgi:hypothetical protein